MKKALLIAVTCLVSQPAWAETSQADFSSAFETCLAITAGVENIDVALASGWQELPAPAAASRLRGEGWVILQKDRLQIEASPIDYVHMRGRQCSISLRGESVGFDWLRQRPEFSIGTTVDIDDPSGAAELLRLSKNEDGFITTVRAQRQTTFVSSTHISISVFRTVESE